MSTFCLSTKNYGRGADKLITILAVATTEILTFFEVEVYVHPGAG